MSKRPRNKQASNISSLLEKILADKGLDKKLQKYRAWTIWDEVVGPQIARQAQPLRIRESTLEVRVANATWMQQLQLLKPKILKELNKQLGKNCLTDIYWKRGEIKHAEAPKKNKSQSKKMKCIDIPDEVTSSFSRIKDPELQNIMLTVLKRDYNEKQS